MSLNLYLTNALTSKLVEDRSKAEATPQPAVATAARPDVRVLVQNAVALINRDRPYYFLGVSVQNHSPVPVYISQVAVATTENRVIIGGRDCITKQIFKKTTLEPGQALEYHMSIFDLESSGATRDKFDYVYATDQVGRTYKSPPGQLMKSIKEIERAQT